MGVPEQRRKKRRTARLVSPISNSGSYARQPILRQRENYTWKRYQDASQKKEDETAKQVSRMASLLAGSNSRRHPCTDLRLYPGHIFSTQGYLLREGIAADKVVDG
ncbi:hypothetical protein BU58_08055 [Escherichia coli O26:H11 str. 2011C-3274]|nr:hypothetical protein BU59_05920 [Escherichia coli O69:H11 str. 07-3763]KDV67674.1 hypothetical protein BU58_08055 [Escherichia coli O26:H11 str. 2011C-3274]KDV73310.1 hypothetical protein BU63_13390 [Escherichia coli O118:H16 str. 07-4255]